MLQTRAKLFWAIFSPFESFRTSESDLTSSTTIKTLQCILSRSLALANPRAQSITKQQLKRSQDVRMHFSRPTCGLHQCIC